MPESPWLGVKMLTKLLGIWPLTKGFRFGRREGIYTTLLISTGLTFGSICQGLVRLADCAVLVVK